ncbi:MAG: hypothetical protein ACRERD_27445 [Candidatus Binatia bacterium]
MEGLLRCRSREGLCIASCKPFFRIVILATVGWLLVAEAGAHRDRGPDDPCRRQLGASLLHLTLYQPQFAPDGEYCEEVPREGQTIMVVDVTAGELRQVPMSLEVVTTGDAGPSHTILQVPPKIYPLGVADTEVTLNAGSDYVVRVVLAQGANTEPQLLSFPIQVAAWYKALLIPALLVLALLALTAISIVRYQMSPQQNRSGKE